MSEETFIKEAAATALGHFRDPRIIPELIMLLKDGNVRGNAAQSLVLIGDTAIEPLLAFLYDPKASEVVAESERVLSFATTRLSAADALRGLVLETLKILRWEIEPEEQVRAVASARRATSRREMRGPEQLTACSDLPQDRSWPTPYSNRSPP